MTTTSSAGCPTPAGMTVTPSTTPYEAGDVLTCGSDGYIATYAWSGNDGTGTVTDETNPYTLPAGPFTLTCTADVRELDCTATITIRNTAYSKYQKQHNILVTVLMLATLFVD